MRDQTVDRQIEKLDRKRGRQIVLLIIWAACVACFPSQLIADDESKTQLKIEAPKIAVLGQPVSKLSLRFETSDTAGPHPMRVRVSGVKLAGFDDINLDDLEIDLGKPLVFETNSEKGQEVGIVDGTITVEGVDDGSRLSVSASVRQAGVWSILPPLLAIVLAVLIRNVLVSLLVAVAVGVAIVTLSPVETALQTVTILASQLIPKGGDYFQLQIVVFTLFLGATIGVMTASGGTRAMVDRLAGYTNSRSRSQVLTSLMGVVVFFDDYANMLLVGSTMRPVTDRQRVSREKLAFLVDSTAAPIAGLALISTWVGAEIGWIKEALEAQQLSLGDAEVTAKSVLIWTLPYRFYPIFLLAFVFAIAKTGRDFGPMRAAEYRAFTTGEVIRETRSTNDSISTIDPTTACSAGGRDAAQSSGSLLNAIVPIFVLIVSVVGGISLLPDEAVMVLMWAAIAASVSSIVVAASDVNRLSAKEIASAWLGGAQSMLLGVVVLVLAWSIAEVCSGDNLNTAAYLVDLIGGQVSPEWLPALAFLLSAAVAFATGSSFATMGLLIPLFVSMSKFLLSDASVDIQDIPLHATTLATLGAILAGAIFGDHCSPISDTTVLSSAAAGCDHMDHVGTQLPYAFTVGLVSLVGGYIPAGFGVSPWICLPLSAGVLVLIVRFVGRTPDTPSV